MDPGLRIANATDDDAFVTQMLRLPLPPNQAVIASRSYELSSNITILLRHRDMQQEALWCSKAWFESFPPGYLGHTWQSHGKFF